MPRAKSPNSSAVDFLLSRVIDAWEILGPAEDVVARVLERAEKEVLQGVELRAILTLEGVAGSAVILAAVVLRAFVWIQLASWQYGGVGIARRGKGGGRRKGSEASQ